MTLFTAGAARTPGNISDELYKFVIIIDDMEEFALIFRHLSGSSMPTQEQINATLPHWENWEAGITAQGKFVTIKRLGYNGKVLRVSGVITDGPFVEIKEQLGGFMIVKAENMDEAIALAYGCPIFDLGGNVEIRPFITRN